MCKNTKRLFTDNDNSLITKKKRSDDIEPSPDNSDDQPDNSDALTENSDDQPENSDDQPENFDASPENFDDQPENFDDQPENSDDQPENFDASPENFDDQPENFDASLDNIDNLNDLSFKLFEKLISIEKINPYDNHVNLSNGQKCDPSKLTQNSVLYKPAKTYILSGNPTFLDNNFDIFNTIAKTCWSSNQFTDVVIVPLTTIAHKIKKELGECICSVEFFDPPNLNEMTNLNDIANLNAIINFSETNLTASSDSDEIPNLTIFDLTKNILKKGIELIEKSDVSETIKKGMLKKLADRTSMGKYRVLNGYFVHDQNNDIETLGLLNFVEAKITQSQKLKITKIDLRKIKALTFKLTRYEAVEKIFY